MKHHYIPQFYLRPWLGEDHKLEEFGREPYTGQIRSRRRVDQLKWPATAVHRVCGKGVRGVLPPHAAGKIVRLTNEAVIGQGRKYVYGLDGSNIAEVRRLMGKRDFMLLLPNMRPAWHLCNAWRTSAKAGFQAVF